MEKLSRQPLNPTEAYPGYHFRGSTGASPLFHLFSYTLGSTIAENRSLVGGLEKRYRYFCRAGEPIGQPLDAAQCMAVLCMGRAC